MKIIYFSSAVILLILLVMTMTIEKKNRIIFFGDSITEYGDYGNGYIRRIETAMMENNKLDDHELIGAGIAGNKVDDLYRRLTEDVSDRDPDVVVICIGINDVLRQLTGNGIGIKEFEESYKSIIEDLQEKNIKVVLCTLSVIGEKKNNANNVDALLDAYSAVIRKLSKVYDCLLIDLRAAFLKYENEHNSQDKDNGILTNDGVHLNDRGNQLVADEMIKVLFPQQ